MMTKSLTAEQVVEICAEKTVALFKFVFVGGDYRIVVLNEFVEHAMMVARDEVPKSAGFFSVVDGELSVSPDGSMTLKTYPDQHDEARLSIYLGIPMRKVTE